MTLGIIETLIERFHSEGVIYCHWKSNENIAASLKGLTDLDLLFLAEEQGQVERILVQTGFKLFKAVPDARYLGIVDYIGFDPGTTRIVHVHAHFRLTVGEQHLKGYHLPWEQLLLDTRVFLPDQGLYVAHPNLETVLLLTREALKHRNRDVIKGVWRNRWLGNHAARELDWLLERLDLDEVAGLFRQLVGKRSASYVPSVLDSDATLFAALPFVFAVKRSLRSHRMCGAIASRITRWKREARFVVLRGSQKLVGRTPFGLPARRVRPGIGPTIAFVGTDGSGKSTALHSTAQWLGQKVDALPLYLGSGQGPSSLIRKPFQLVRNMVVKRGKGRTPWQKSTRTGGSPEAPLYTALRTIWALLLIRERKQKLRSAKRAKSRGMIVLTDRFPQAQVHGFNDGPLLSSLENSRLSWLRGLAAWEQSQYEKLMELYSPDLVIRLNVSPEVAAIRRPEMSLEESSSKQEALLQIKWPASTKVITINADQDIAQVTHDIRVAVWQEL